MISSLKTNQSGINFHIVYFIWWDCKGKGAAESVQKSLDTFLSLKNMNKCIFKWL